MPFTSQELLELANVIAFSVHFHCLIGRDRSLRENNGEFVNAIHNVTDVSWLCRVNKNFRNRSLRGARSQSFPFTFRSDVIAEDETNIVLLDSCEGFLFNVNLWRRWHQ